MPHQNRSKKRGPGSNPLPADIVDARLKAKLSMRDAAKLIHATERAWLYWETGQRRMHPAMWELFKSKAGR